MLTHGQWLSTGSDMQGVLQLPVHC